MLGLLWLNVSLNQLFRAPKSLAHLDCFTILKKLPYFPMQFKEIASFQNIPHFFHCKNLLKTNTTGLPCRQTLTLRTPFPRQSPAGTQKPALLGFTSGGASTSEGGAKRKAGMPFTSVSAT